MTNNRHIADNLDGYERISPIQSFRSKLQLSDFRFQISDSDLTLVVILVCQALRWQPGNWQFNCHYLLRQVSFVK